ncbi:hypothetical protein ACMYR3_15665 [Ampullimonas aquatilis]|uniref:hypothetical protein n=1 Tax=Ampullimonas aquatilis TaxID=1341549 RepID=UPI003C74B180
MLDIHELIDFEPQSAATIVYGRHGQIDRIVSDATRHYVGVQYQGNRISLQLFDQAHNFIKGYWVRNFAGMWHCDEIDHAGGLMRLGAQAAAASRAGLQPLRDIPDLMSAFVTLMCAC